MYICMSISILGHVLKISQKAILPDLLINFTDFIKGSDCFYAFLVRLRNHIRKDKI